MPAYPAEQAAAARAGLLPPIASTMPTTTSSAPTISHENVAEVDGTAKMVVHVFAEAWKAVAISRLPRVCW
jgi:hypothetical protein